MQLVHTIAEMRVVRRELPTDKSIGFVPTMGYLHEGHLSLVKASNDNCDITIVSIYVNPSQFGPNEDLSSYPRDLERDLHLLSQYGVDYVFFPTNEQIYPPNYKTWVEVEGLSGILCGASRPGHFRGVATIVLKLVNIVKPDHIFMGSKDFQQVKVLQTMLRDLNLESRIVACPIVREADGLAMSSRNSYLDPAQRQRALCLSQAIKLVQQATASGERDATKLQQIAEEHCSQYGQVDYIQIVDSENLQPLKQVDSSSRIIMAVFIDRVRLIDNAALGE